MKTVDVFVQPDGSIQMVHDDDVVAALGEGGRHGGIGCLCE